MAASTAIAAVGAGAATAGAVNSIVKGSGSGGTQAQADAQGAQAEADRQQALGLWNGLNTPTLNTTPHEGQTWLQDFNPQTYDPYIGSVQNIQDSPQARADEMTSLGQLQQFAKGGLQPADMIALGQIQRQQAAAGSSAGAAAADALRARGAGGAGAEYAARLAGDQQAANSTSGLYDNAMKAAMDRQLQAVNQSGAAASAIRGQDVGISAQMAAINNNFNTQVQNLRTAAAQNNATTRNNAQAANLAGHQAVANSNVLTDNTNLDRVNALAQQDFGNQTTKLQGQTNSLNGLSTLASANQAALSKQALGQDQSTTAGLEGLAGVAKSVSGPGGFFNTTTGGNTTNANGSSASFDPSTLGFNGDPNSAGAGDLQSLGFFNPLPSAPASS